MTDIAPAILAAVEARIVYLKEQYIMALDDETTSDDIKHIIYGNIHEAKCIKIMIEGMINVASHL